MLKEIKSNKMNKFKVTLTREIIKAFITETYEVEASSKEEAKQLIDENDGEFECIEYDVDVRDTEILSIEIE